MVLLKGQSSWIVYLLIVGMLTLFAPFTLRSQVLNQDEATCRAFVQKFYDWRVSLLIDMFCPNPLKGTAADQEAIRTADEECKAVSTYRNAEKLSLDQVLSPKLLQYLKREEAMQKKEGDAGLDFDPYLNTQDPSPKYVVGSIRVKDAHCDAVVHGYDQGGRQRDEIMPELAKISGRWYFENFHYHFESEPGQPAQNDDLVHMIREYLGDIPYPNH